MVRIGWFLFYTWDLALLVYVVTAFFVASILFYKWVKEWDSSIIGKKLPDYPYGNYTWSGVMIPVIGLCLAAGFTWPVSLWFLIAWYRGRRVYLYTKRVPAILAGEK